VVPVTRLVLVNISVSPLSAFFIWKRKFILKLATLFYFFVLNPFLCPIFRNVSLCHRPSGKIEATELWGRGRGLLTAVSLKTDMSDIVSGSLMHDFNLECLL